MNGRLVVCLTVLAVVVVVSKPGWVWAEYPDGCLGIDTPSAPDCSPIEKLGETGCCDELGRVVWCEAGELFCIDCAEANPDCGWSEQAEFYDCGTDGLEDPDGVYVLSCSGCSPPCQAGHTCQAGQCVVCVPDCDGKSCGTDGCGSNCGDCLGTATCHKGQCAYAGCVATGQAGCACGCEACVCDILFECCFPAWLPEFGWNEECASLCSEVCNGCPPVELCGNGNCDDSEGENCGLCPDDCECPEGHVCKDSACCLPSCGEMACGDDGCGGDCGDCDVGFKCSSEGMCEPFAECLMIGSIGCDDVVDGHTDGVQNVLEQYACSWSTFTGPEIAYEFVPKVDDKISINLQVAGWASLYALVLKESCAEQACLDYDSSLVTVNVTAGTSYFIVVDGISGSKGSFELTLSCASDCVSDCLGKECGDDGCGGSCGTCEKGACSAGQCASGSGCLVTDEPGCGGCSCEACVCEMDGWCCEFNWDEFCVGECQDFCGGCDSVLNCGDGQCQIGEDCNSCAADCACLEEELCVGGACCAPSCGAKQCGDDGCGGSCGQCIEGTGCLGGKCLANDGCVSWNEPGCGECECQECVCELDSFCCTGTWDQICVGLCSYQCLGCGAPESCGNGLCELADKENCQTCPDDCVCPGKFTCHKGECCPPDCTGKNCGDDGCGGTCGTCAPGTCIGGKCYSGAGCQETVAAGCEECACKDCVCGLVPACCSKGWAKECVSACVLLCGGCGILSSCGDGKCSKGLGEHCGNCSEDCNCGMGLVCAGHKCHPDFCTAGLGPQGCCEGETLYACFDDKLKSMDCAQQGTVCGWYDGVGSPPSYTCGKSMVVLPEDPNGEFSAQCPSVCLPNCVDGECGEDGCGGICGLCAAGEECKAGKCQPVCLPACDGKACGPDGCGGQCGTCSQGQYCTMDGECALNHCVSAVNVECGAKLQGNTAEFENKLNGYACTAWDESGPELGYVFVPGKTDQVTLVLTTGQDNDQDVFVLQDACTVDNCLHGGDWVEFLAELGSTYYFVVDGFAGDSGPYDLEIFCESQCLPDCAGKECGDDGCLGDCGICGAGLYCVDNECLPNNGCMATVDPGCGNCSCQQCVCDVLPGCCLDQWHKLCVAECLDNCGGCDLFTWCGDGLCDVLGGENCDDCPADCPCSEDEKCANGICIPACIPDCTERECGPDGCGGTCGQCAEGALCLADGTCLCMPDCKGKECGNDGCDGNCGECPEFHMCDDTAKCVCIPDCGDKECGADGCGGKCGKCAAGNFCNVDGTCVAFSPDAPLDPELCSLEAITEDTPGIVVPKDASGIAPDSGNSAKPDATEGSQPGGGGSGCTASGEPNRSELGLLLLLVVLLSLARYGSRNGAAAASLGLGLVLATSWLGCGLSSDPVPIEHGKDGNGLPGDNGRSDHVPRSGDARFVSDAASDSVVRDTKGLDLGVWEQMTTDADATNAADAADAVDKLVDECHEGCDNQSLVCIYPLADAEAAFASLCSMECSPQYLGADCLSLGTQLTCCGPALDGAGDQGFYCVPSTGCCVECGLLCCPLATHDCVGDDDACIPKGHTYCGNGQSCPEGKVCKPDGGCCEAATPWPCGTICCALDEECIVEDQVCIPQGATYCGDGLSCALGYVCTPTGCCEETKPIPCGPQCCPIGTECALECEVCLMPGEELCDDCSICGLASACMFGGGCMPDGSDDCGEGIYCAPGMVCVQDGGVPCCPQNKPQVCGHECCFADYKCVHEEELCICPECAYCGEGHWCKPGWECMSQCADAADPNGCCMPLGSTDCNDGTYCDPGQVCVGFNKKCCPAAAPQLCGDTCCPDDYECINFGEACVPPGAKYCEKWGIICDPGTECMNSIPDCMPVGSQDCGVGKYCGPGKVCVDGGQDGCCPGDAPMACGSQCCPDTDECIEDCEMCVPDSWTYCGDCMMCGPGMECMQSADQCMPLGAEDCLDGTYCNIGYLCAPGLKSILPTEGGGGCQPSDQPGCDGCSCESCVCSLDNYCCEEKWDSVCAMLCEASCGQTCAEICEPECSGKQCGDDGCGGACGVCYADQVCESGICMQNDGGCAATLLPGCDGCDCEDCVCQEMPDCCLPFGWWGGGWDGDCVAQCQACGGCEGCHPDCAGKQCGPDGCGESCGQCNLGEVCELETVACVACEPDCEGKACGSDGCGAMCGTCSPGTECTDDVCKDSPKGTGKCCPVSAPIGCNKACCPAGDKCIASDGDGLCLPPGADYCGDGLYCLSGETCMNSCNECMPDGATDCGGCTFCKASEVCAGVGKCCPAAAPVGCGNECCAEGEICVADGGWSGTGMCVPPGGETCKPSKTYCVGGKMCKNSCFEDDSWFGNPCVVDGSEDCGDCSSCSPGKQCCGDYCCSDADKCYPTGGKTGVGMCVAPGGVSCWGDTGWCAAGYTCMSSCQKCMAKNNTDCGNCSSCSPGKSCATSCKGCFPAGSQDCGDCTHCGPGKKCCGHYCCNSSDTCYPTGGKNGNGMCVPPGGVNCGKWWCTSGKTCMTSCNGCMPVGGCDNGGCGYCNPGKKCGMDGFCYN